MVTCAHDGQVFGEMFASKRYGFPLLKGLFFLVGPSCWQGPNITSENSWFPSFANYHFFS